MQDKGLTENKAYAATEKWFKEKQFASDLETELLGAQLALFEPEMNRTDLTPFGRIHRAFFDPTMDKNIDEFPKYTNEETVADYYEELVNTIEERIEASLPQHPPDEQEYDRVLTETMMRYVKTDPDVAFVNADHEDGEVVGVSHSLIEAEYAELEEKTKYLDPEDGQDDEREVQYSELLGSLETSSIKYRALHADIPDLEYFPNKNKK